MSRIWYEEEVSEVHVLGLHNLILKNNISSDDYHGSRSITISVNYLHINITDIALFFSICSHVVVMFAVDTQITDQLFSSFNANNEKFSITEVDQTYLQLRRPMRWHSKDPPSFECT